MLNNNKIFIAYKYNHLLHDDGNNGFKMINFYFNNNIDYELYLIIHELNQHTEKNVFYYKKYICNELFYDENSTFIIKRKKLFMEIQKFNLGLFKLKHILNMKYKKPKNNFNLYGEPVKQHHIQLIEDGSKYNFDFFEMYNIVSSAFKQVNDYLPIILNIKNPYTNKNFSYFNVINIYFILMNNERIPKYFYLYFHSNLSKKQIYNHYHINLFIDMMKYKYSRLSSEIKLKYIDKMLEYYNHYQIIGKSDYFKLYNLSNIGLSFFLALKIINYRGDENYEIYEEYIEDCKKRLTKIRMNNYTQYTVKMH